MRIQPAFHHQKTQWIGSREPEHSPTNIISVGKDELQEHSQEPKLLLKREKQIYMHNKHSLETYKTKLAINCKINFKFHQSNLSIYRIVLDPPFSSISDHSPFFLVLFHIQNAVPSEQNRKQQHGIPNSPNMLVVTIHTNT